MNKIELNLSNTALGFSGCALALKRVVQDGYTEPAMDAKLIYGVAIHKFLDTCYKTSGYIPDAYIESAKVFNIPKNDDRKSPHISDLRHMQNVALATWQVAVLPDKDFEILMLDGKAATELNFSIKYYEDDNIIVNLCGTLDRIGKIKGGCWVIRDWKTTSAWNPKEYFKSYDLSRQLRLYVLAIKLMSENYPDSVLGQIGKTNIGTQINAIFLKPEANATKWQNSEVFTYPDWEMKEFRDGLDKMIRKISVDVKEGKYEKEGIINGHCQMRYGMCKFFNVCSVNETVGKILLERDFIKRPFNPLDYSA